MEQATGQLAGLIAEASDSQWMSEFSTKYNTNGFGSVISNRLRCSWSQLVSFTRNSCCWEKRHINWNKCLKEQSLPSLGLSLLTRYVRHSSVECFSNLVCSWGGVSHSKEIWQLYSYQSHKWNLLLKPGPRFCKTNYICYAWFKTHDEVLLVLSYTPVASGLGCCITETDAWDL